MLQQYSIDTKGLGCYSAMRLFFRKKGNTPKRQYTFISTLCFLALC